MLQRFCQWIFWLGFFAAGLFVEANETSNAPSLVDLTHYKIRRWTTEDGLPQNRIACIQQTRDGYLWLGTWFGLARFDGVRFTVFNKQNTPALALDAITALAEDSEGSLWLGTRAGLVKYAGGKFFRFTVADGLPADQIWQVTAARAGGIWLQAGNKIVRAEHDKFVTVWEYPDGDTVHSLQTGADGRLNVFLNYQWLRLMPESGRQTNVTAIKSRDRIFNAGLSASAHTAFVGTAEGLQQLDFGNTNAIFAGGLSGAPADFLLRDRAANIWAQTRTQGLLRFDGTNWQPIPLGEAHGDIVCAVQDAQGDYWFGTAEGLVQLQLQKVRTFTARDGLPADNVWSVCETLDEKIWVGTDRGLAMIQSNQVTAYSVPNGIPFQPFRCVGPARAGGVWVAGQFNGVFKFRNGNIEEQLNVELPGLPNVLCEDKSGRLWVGTSGGVRCFQNGQAQALGPGMESLRDVHAILEDPAGDFWFGLKNGELARLHAGQLSVVTAPAGWPGGGVWAIHEDADGDLWLGTENGLVRRSGVRQDFFSFAAPPQMPADPVNCILEDDFGCLWWSTLHGVFRGERAQLKAVADGKMATFQPFILGTADGMKTAESNGETQPAGWKARDGCLWFPTGKGLVVIDPKLFAAKENPPRTLLESVKADGVELDGQANREIKISAGRGHALEFRFTLCDLTAPEQVRFQTRLSGVSDAWSEPTANRAAHFFNLPPGNYRFAVRGMEHHGLWGAPTTWEFFIAPCFWQTWWFYLACAGGVVFLAAVIQAYRLHWQRRLLKIEQQRVLASERARIARDLHDDLGTALTGMALELDVLGRDACGNLPLIDRLAKASQHTRQLAERMREVVWVVNPRCDNLRSLADFLEDQVAGLLHAAGLKVHLEFPLEIPERPMSANVRHQLALSVREAFSNLIRHARATEASVRLELTDELLFIVIRDNGCGFSPPAHVEKEHGLINMRARMEEIGGCFECVSAPGAGTTLTLCVSLQKIQPRDK